MSDNKQGNPEGIYTIPPAKARVMDVIYYDHHKKRAKLEKYGKEMKLHSYDKTYMFIRHGVISFKTFDDAVEFIDNLGFDNIMLEVAAITPQAVIYDEHTDHTFNLMYEREFDVKQFIFRQHIFTKEELFETRITDTHKLIGNEYKVNLQFAAKNDVVLQ